MRHERDADLTFKNKSSTPIQFFFLNLLSKGNPGGFMKTQSVFFSSIIFCTTAFGSTAFDFKASGIEVARHGCWALAPCGEAEVEMYKNAKKICPEGGLQMISDTVDFKDELIGFDSPLCISACTATAQFRCTTP